MEKFVVRSESNSNFANKRPREKASSTSPDQWRLPKKFVANPKEVSKEKETPVNNRFGGLPVDEAESESYRAATKKIGSNNTPPIVIEVQDKWSLEKIRETIKKYIKDNFHMQYRGHKLVRVQCYSAISHQQLKDGLKKENVAFHTFTRRDEILPKAVIKGLPKFAQVDVPEELASLGFAEATVSELKTAQPSECPPLLVQLSSGTNMTKFKQIRYLCSCVIEIQKYKPSRKPGTQCFRCQEFGHASRNCNKPARCVKCADAHPTWECPKKDRIAPARCCNCNKDHPANYTQCDERLKYLERIENKREMLRKAIYSEKSRVPSNSQKTWAQTTGNKKTKPRVSRPQDVIPTMLNATNMIPSSFVKSNQNVALSDARPPVEGVTEEKLPVDFVTTEMLEILTTIQTIKKEYKMCKTFMEKVILILTHLGHYV